MNSNVSGYFSDEIRRESQLGIMRMALQILQEAWHATIRDERVTRGSLEKTISDVLRFKMSAIKRLMDPSPAMRFEREPQSDAADNDSDLGLIDIMVCFGWDEESYCVIECKRLSSNDAPLSRKYISHGVNRFASGKYSAGHPYGAMVGYVLCGNRELCDSKIKGWLAEAPASETGYDSSFGWRCAGDALGIDDANWTVHFQSQFNNSISLIHLFLDIPEFALT